MLFRPAFVTLLLAVATIATPFNSTARRACGTVISNEQARISEAHFQANKVTPKQSFADATTDIKVYFHVVSKDTTLAGGNIPDSQIAAQIAVMNQAYAPAGLNFVLAGTTRTVNSNWFNTVGPLGTIQTTMKKSLRKGTAADLNVYTVGFVSGDGANLLGYSTFPDSFTGNPTDDGVVILYSSVPGGTDDPYNLGQTLTHETGHWLGLYHTFQGGCDEPGDMVDDTPPESGPSFGCPTGRDTCPGSGVDPINNFMDYSDDACMTQFTPGQIARLQAQIATYRGINV